MYIVLTTDTVTAVLNCHAFVLPLLRESAYVCGCVVAVIPAKTTEPVALPFGLWRERDKFINHKQINDVTIKIINSCCRLPVRKIPSSWPPMQIQIILFYI